MKKLPKENPFRVPESYFERFPERLSQRISQMEAEQVPVRKLDSKRRLRLAIAAAIAGLVLISFPLARILTTGSAADEKFIEIALLDGAGLFSSDYELVSYLEEADMDDEEAYLSLAVDYLASSDLGMDLIFE